MNETALIAGFRAALLPRLPGVEIVQGYQPTTQGVPDGPALVLYAVTDVDYGWVKRSQVWDEPTQQFVTQETQIRETTLQVNAVIPGIGLSAETPAELCSRARAHLRSDVVLADLRASGLSILRVRDTRRVWTAQADGGQPESNPSFDVTVRHSDILTATAPAVTATAIIIERA